MKVPPGPQRRVDVEELRREVLVLKDTIGLTCVENKKRGRVARKGGGRIKLN